MDRGPPTPPRERFWEFITAVSLASLLASIGLGAFSSVTFFNDSHGMTIPLQSAAQSFIMFASIISAFYVVFHIAALLRGNKLYEDFRREIFWEPPNTTADKFAPFVHHLHAWTRLLSFLALLSWIGALTFVVTLLRQRTEAALVLSGEGDDATGDPDFDKAMYYLRYGMGASIVGVVGSLLLTLVVWCVKRPYGVTFYKKVDVWDGGVFVRPPSVSAAAARSKRSSTSSATDAGSVMSGETAVAPPASAEAAAAPGVGEKEQKLKDDVGVQPDRDRRYRSPSPQRGPPGGFPGEG
ncbi:hypothetical protein QBC39DRAFT_339499 [Podospora conica]|nr:hypothetical protein QBC39DRAFT_339499 [Schizothecium conicum]